MLVHAHRKDSPFHQAAFGCVESLATGTARWSLPWPCVHEFISVVTNPRIYRRANPIALALKTVQAIEELPNLEMLAEGPGYLGLLTRVSVTAQCHGGMIHDARIAALCLHHGVTELWSADRDFSRFPELKTVNPLPA